METQITSKSELILQTVLMLGQRVASLDEKLTDVHQTITATPTEPEMDKYGRMSSGKWRRNQRTKGRRRKTPVVKDKRGK
jgi:hypothetical protein